MRILDFLRQMRQLTLLRKLIDPDAEIIFGTTINENLKDEVVVTVIATGFEDEEKGLPPKSLRSAFDFAGSERSLRDSSGYDRTPRYDYGQDAQSNQEQENTSSEYRQEEPAKDSEAEKPRRSVYSFEDEGEIHIPSFLRKKS